MLLVKGVEARNLNSLSGKFKSLLKTLQKCLLSPTWSVETSTPANLMYNHLFCWDGRQVLGKYPPGQYAPDNIPWKIILREIVWGYCPRYCLGGYCPDTGCHIMLFIRIYMKHAKNCWIKVPSNLNSCAILSPSVDIHLAVFVLWDHSDRMCFHVEVLLPSNLHLTFDHMITTQECLSSVTTFDPICGLRQPW